MIAGHVAGLDCFKLLAHLMKVSPSPGTLTKFNENALGSTIISSFHASCFIVPKAKEKLAGFAGFARLPVNT